MNLGPRDIELHARLGIPADLLRRAGVRRVDDREARDLLALNGSKGQMDGIFYPYVHPRARHRVTGRVRLDHPPLRADGSPEGKYRSGYGDNRHLFFPPGAEQYLTDVSVPLIVVESEKAGLALTAATERAGIRALVIGLGGCWNFRGVVGKAVSASGERVPVKGFLPDFELITMSGRRAVILFDARPNDSVRAARRELARGLRARGADVQHAHLPDDDDRVNGPDDLIATSGDAALWRVIERAVAEDFTRDNNGRIVAASLDNIRIALSRLGVALAYNSFSREVLINGQTADDVTVDGLWIGIDDTYHFRPPKDVLHTVITAEAHASPMHPVRRYLDRVSWDGIPRIDTWLSTYGGAADADYTRAVGALVLIAAVRRVRQPGVKFDELLVLESAQGKLKSSALRALCPDESLFSDDLPLGVDSKLVIERTTGRWIIEAAELHGNRGREAEQLKAFLSRQVDGPVRLAYGRIPVTVPRQFVIIGTTNSSLAYLKDATGARRFWPVSIAGFDVAAILRDRDQLWAEAAHREAAGESIRLAPELWDAAGKQQEGRRASDPWEEIIEPLLVDEDGDPVVDRITATEIWAALGVMANQRDNRHADRVAGILQRHGFTRKTKERVAGSPAWCWRRP